jgi:hypothetical protein
MTEDTGFRIRPTVLRHANPEEDAQGLATMTGFMDSPVLSGFMHSADARLSLECVASGGYEEFEVAVMSRRSLRRCSTPTR